jgi:hypothetical protein
MQDNFRQHFPNSVLPIHSSNVIIKNIIIIKKEVVKMGIFFGLMFFCISIWGIHNCYKRVQLLKLSPQHKDKTTNYFTRVIIVSVIGCISFVALTLAWNNSSYFSSNSILVVFSLIGCVCSYIMFPLVMMSIPTVKAAEIINHINYLLPTYENNKSLFQITQST